LLKVIEMTAQLLLWLLRRMGTEGATPKRIFDRGSIAHRAHIRIGVGGAAVAAEPIRASSSQGLERGTKVVFDQLLGRGRRLR